jgi:signal transduction histidine kinase
MATMDVQSPGESGSAGERTILAAMLRLAALPKDDWEASMQQILQIASEVLGTARVSYWSLREHPRLIHCDMGYIAGPRAIERGCILLESDHPCYFAEMSRTPVVAIDDAQNDVRSAELLGYLRVRKIASLLDVPVWTRGSRVGVLCNEHTGSIRHWTDADVDFAMSIAQTVEAALEAQACGEAETGRRRSALLDQSSLRLTKVRDVAAVAGQAVAMAVPELADGAMLDVLEEGRLVRIGLAHRTEQGHALLEEMTRRFPPSAYGPHPVTSVLRLHQSVLVPDLARAHALIKRMDAGEVRLIEELGIRSAIAIPLLAGERVLGIMQFHAIDRQFDQRDLRFMEDFGERVGVALENARLHEKADAAIRARDEFIAVAAHELHGPLTSLQLSAESFAASLIDAPEASTKMSRTILRQTQRLNRLVDHMLDASRIMTKRISLAVSPVNLSKLVEEIASSFSERSERAGSVLTMHIAPDIVGYWDGDRLAQVVSNLLDNAVKFGSSMPIDVSLQLEGGDAVLNVRDRGIGIAPEQTARIFEPFKRAVSPRSYGGLGLGLFMCKAIVEAHRGAIDVESQPGEGSSFTVRLPRSVLAAQSNRRGDQQ